MAGSEEGPPRKQLAHPDGPDFQVVGAGAAGLAAAWRLGAARPHGTCRVRVLEASDRIG